MVIILSIRKQIKKAAKALRICKQNDKEQRDEHLLQRMEIADIKDDKATNTKVL